MKEKTGMYRCLRPGWPAVRSSTSQSRQGKLNSARRDGRLKPPKLQSAITSTNTFTFPLSLSADTYYVIGDDGGGCTGRSESCIIYSSTPLNFGFYVIDNNSCNGVVNNGKIYITGITGTPPYTYLWSNGETTDFITGLTSNAYTVTVTDSNGCTTSLGTTINTIPGVTITSTIPTQPTCFNNDGQVIVNVAGGTGPYFFSGSNGDTVITFTPSYTFTNLGHGSLTVFVQDAGLCSDITSVLLLNPNAFSIASITSTNSTCSNNNGTITYPYINFCYLNLNLERMLGQLSLG